MSTAPLSRPTPLDRFLQHRADIALMGPYLLYLLLLALRDQEWLGLGYEQRWIASLIRGTGALVLVWMFRRHLPLKGPCHWHIAIPAGIFSAALWVAGEHWLRSFDWYSVRLPLPLFSGEPEFVDPRDTLGAYRLYWVTVVTRITTAVITVPVVEELFWRAFMLRAFINWTEFEKVPLGKFTLYSFIGTALLSTVQHPDNWGVSIACWLVFNALFYWKTSVPFIIVVHGVTNLALYIYVVQTKDWIFW